MITDLKSQLTRDEGRRLHAYQDTEGFWTIGIGHRIYGLTDEQCAVLEWTDADCDAQYEKDAHHSYTHMLSLAPWAVLLDDVRRAALQNMWFNMGDKVLEFYNMIDCLRKQDWSGAAAQMLNSKWAGQVGARASRLAEQIRVGTWQ